MPSLSLPSEGSSENATSAFTVLTSDNFGMFGKPNAIVRPIRRLEPTEDTRMGQDDATRSFTNQPNEQTKLASFEMGRFAKELDFKLKNLQSDKKLSSKNVIIKWFSISIFDLHYYNWIVKC